MYSDLSEFYDTLLNFLVKFLPYALLPIMFSALFNLLRRLIGDDFYIPTSKGTCKENNFLCNGKCKGCDMNKEHCVIKTDDKFCHHCLYNDYSLFDNCKNCKYSEYNETYKEFIEHQKEFES